MSQVVAAQELLTLQSEDPVDDENVAEVVDFYDLTRAELSSLLTTRFGVSPYRAQQLYEWVYRHGIADFLQMTNVGRELRESFSQTFDFPMAVVRDRQISSDGTRKYLLEVAPGAVVESVMIKQPKRMTLCVSSQVGCGMGCTFCRTGTMGFIKNLSASQIIRQVLAVIEDAKNFDDMFSNIVFMGLGEPLHNFSGVTRAVQILTDHFGLAIPGRKITVSTVGLVPAIERFGRLGLDANLAVSLNATTDEIRSQIMPINKRFGLESLLEALRNYPIRGRRRITIEYVLLAGVNDSAQDLSRLPKLLRGIRAKVNLIPYNENAGLGFKTPSRETIMSWQDGLNRRGIEATIRWSKGQDISAACGQLAVKESSPELLQSAE